MSATIIEKYTFANTIAWHKKWPICTLKEMQYEKGFSKKFLQTIRGGNAY